MKSFIALVVAATVVLFGLGTVAYAWHGGYGGCWWGGEGPGWARYDRADVPDAGYVKPGKSGTYATGPRYRSRHDGGRWWGRGYGHGRWYGHRGRW